MTSARLKEKIRRMLVTQIKLNYVSSSIAIDAKMIEVVGILGYEKHGELS